MGYGGCMGEHDQVLLVCMDRSGSNLVHGIINQHPEVYLAPALPLFELVFPVRELYDTPLDDRAWADLIQDMVDLTNANHRPLPRMDVTVEEVRGRLGDRPRSLGAVIQAIYRLQADARRRRVGGVKFGPSWDKVRPFLAQTTWSRAVFQRRDPRDVIISVRRAGFNTMEPERYADYWLRWHREMRAALGEYGIPVMETRYEDLLQRPEDTVDGIFDFLGVAPHPDAVHTYHVDEDQRRAAAASHMWANVARPLQTDNHEKFYREWNARDIAAIEAVLGEGLPEFGYAPADPERFETTDRVPPQRRLEQADRSFHAAQEAVLERITDRHARSVGAAGS